MLHRVGLLPAANSSQLNFAYDFYKDATTPKGKEMASDFKKTFCTNVNVYFIGLWDCVVSVGFIPRKLPLSKTPTNSVRYFRHAMALDEHRAKFKVCQWQNKDPDAVPSVGGIKRHETIDKTPIGKLKRTGVFSGFRSKGRGNPAVNGTAKTNGATVDEEAEKAARLWAKFEAQDKANMRRGQVPTDVLEVWFLGAHADVGGGAVENTERHMLSRIPLRWMIRQCFECNTGIVFETARLAEQGLDVHTLYPHYQQPVKSTIPPPPALMEKYQKKTLAPLKRRSTFLDIGEPEDTIDDAPSTDDLLYILPTEANEDYFDSSLG